MLDQRLRAKRMAHGVDALAQAARGRGGKQWRDAGRVGIRFMGEGIEIA